MDSRGRAAAGDRVFRSAMGGERALKLVDLLAMRVEQRVLLERRAKLLQFLGAVSFLASIRRALNRRAAGDGGLIGCDRWCAHGSLAMVQSILPPIVAVVALNANPHARSERSEGSGFSH